MRRNDYLMSERIIDTNKKFDIKLIIVYYLI